jgi:hypothetical protein
MLKAGNRLTGHRPMWSCTSDMSRPVYLVHRAVAAPEHRGAWEGPAWRDAEKMPIGNFHPRSSEHRPATEAALLYDDRHLHALFRVADRYVRSVHTDYDSDTYKDSCVELFVQPAGRAGYFALEVNCGGAFSLRYIEDPTRTPTGFAKCAVVAPETAATIRIARSLPAVVEPERAGPIDWWVEVAWPFTAMEPYCGPVTPVVGQRWRANAFKCGDQTSHPHWASWAPIGEALNFHQPRFFGGLEFDGSSRD